MNTSNPPSFAPFPLTFNVSFVTDKFNVLNSTLIEDDAVSLTGIMALDENGVLYADSDAKAIYRLLPGSATFELFAGVPNRRGPVQVSDGPRLGTGENQTTPIVGPISYIDAIGTPGYIYVSDEGRQQVLRIGTSKDGKVETIKSECTTIKFIASFPHSLQPLILTRKAKWDWEESKWTPIPESSLRRVHYPPKLTTFDIDAEDSNHAAQRYWYRQGFKTLVTNDFDSTEHFGGVDSTTYVPLATLSPNVTLFMILTATGAQVSAIAWSINEEGKLSIDSVKEDPLIWQTSDNCRASMHAFLYSPATNTFFNWDCERNLLTRVEGLLADSTLAVLAPKKRSTIQSINPSLDLASLPPSWVQDLTLRHKLSNETWSIHKDVFASHIERPTDAEKDAELIASFPLPARVISAFVDYLYFRPYEQPQDPKECYLETSLLIFLCDALGIPNHFFAHHANQLFENDLLTIDHICELLCIMWFNEDYAWTSESVPIKMLATHVKAKASEEMFLASLEKYLAAAESAPSPLRIAKLSYMIPSVDASWVPKTAAVRPHRHAPLDWVISENVPDLECSTDFILSIRTSRLFVKGWILYCNWPWFKRLVDAGMEEAKSRCISLPSWVSQNIVTAIVATTYGIDTRSMALSDEEMALLCENGAELEIIDLSGDALPLFRTLINRCTSSLQERLSIPNCFTLLAHYYERNWMRMVETVLRFIASKQSHLSIADMCNLDDDLFVLVKSAVKAGSKKE